MALSDTESKLIPDNVKKRGLNRHGILQSAGLAGHPARSGHGAGPYHAAEGGIRAGRGSTIT